MKKIRFLLVAVAVTALFAIPFAMDGMRGVIFG